MKTILSGIVKSVTKDSTTIETETGTVITLPRDYGEPGAVGSAVILDFSTGTLSVYAAETIAPAGETKHFMNFYADDYRGAQANVEQKTQGVSGKTMSTQKLTTFVPFGFADVPAGARTVKSSNGSIVFAAPSSVGMATTCDSKVIMRSHGPSEVVSPHMVNVMGKRVYVSDFGANLHIEIDLVNTVAGVAGYDGIKDSIVEAMREGAVTYEDAFASAAEGDPFLKTFGLNIAELLKTYEWSRIYFRGDDKALHEVFGEYLSIDTIYGYCGGCYGAGKTGIVGFELNVVPGETEGKKGCTIPIPSCESNIVSTIYPMTISIGTRQYTVATMELIMGDGSIVDYSYKRRSYAVSHGTMACKTWLSGNKTATFSNSHQVDINTIGFSDITVSGGGEGFCGEAFGLPSISWGGDFNLSVAGGIYINGSGSAYIHAGERIIIGGGAKGILVNNSGSSAITL
jgi:hypothetical protein